MTCTGAGGTASQSATVTVAGGVCLTTGATSAISLPSVNASRLSGVAPLSVFFDAMGTTASATTRPFHDLEYRWDFGDPLGSPVSGTKWNRGSRAGVSLRNEATGAVAAHVYETPGTYTVALNVTDGTNTVSNSCTQILVQDPNVIFALTNTICVGATSTPTAGSGGCPAGANTAQQPNFATITSTYATTGERVLLKRGDTFTTATTAMLTATGPGIVGAYGSGAKPLINMTGNTDTLGFGNSGATGMVADLRVMDLAFDGGGTSVSHGIGNVAGGGGITQVTALRLDFTRFETSIGFGAENLNWANNSNSRSHTIDQLAVVDCTTTNGNNTSYSGYNSGNRVAFMGNSFENGGLQNRYDQLGNLLGAGTHILRFPFLNRAVISNNDILHPGGTRAVIKMHAPFWIAGVPDTTDKSNYSSALNGDGYTKYVIISDNQMVSAQEPWQVAVSPQDAANDERLHDVILERNLHIGTASTQVTQVIRAQEITSRNNIFLAGSANYSYFAQVDVDGGEPPASNVRIYNNTMYKSGGTVNNSDGFTIVNMPNTRISNVTIKNNLGWAPTLTGSVPYINAGITGLTQSNNSTTAQINSLAPPILITNWTPLAGSYAINGGATVPVWSDFYRNNRPQGVIDIGAVEVP